ncbi:MAG: class I SAM-dependent methyltransferase [Verrucomicrobia bacterium]|nr:class I SAM-dependent methyltransferase [Verrucomicrobiota bacterium]
MAYVYGRQHRNKDIAQVFADIYRTAGFKGQESLSGPGSDLDQTELLRRRIPELADEHKIQTILDAPCGDFLWMRLISDHFEHYTGADIVPALVASNQERYGSPRIKFLHADITKDDLPRVDLILCRDCLVHLPYAAINEAILNFKRSGAKFLLATTYPLTTKHVDIIAGLWRPLNLEQTPFNFPPPIAAIQEEPTEAGGLYHDKTLGLWRVAQLPEA